MCIFITILGVLIFELIIMVGYKIYHDYLLSMAEAKKEFLLDKLEERKDVDGLIELIKNRDYHPENNALKRFLKSILKPN